MIRLLRRLALRFTDLREPRDTDVLQYYPLAQDKHLIWRDSRGELHIEATAPIEVSEGVDGL